MTAPVPVLVTAVGGGGVGEQILKALRLAETAYSIVATDVRAASSGLVGADAAYVVPPAADDGYVGSLLAVCRRHDVRMVFPGSEAELRVLAAHAEEFAAAGAPVACCPPDVLDVCLDKTATMRRLEELGFGVPRWLRFTTVEEALAFDELPAVVKPATGGGGSAGLHLCQDRDELAAAALATVRQRGGGIVQAYVGTPEHEYTVGVLADLDGELLGSIGLRRDLGSALSVRIKAANRTTRAELGPALVVSSGISQGWIAPYPDLTRRCEEAATALGARGAINIQCRLVDGEPEVFEINPRFSGTTSIRALVGYNEPDALVRRHVLGETIERPLPHRSAHVARALAEVLVSDEGVARAEELG